MKDNNEKNVDVYEKHEREGQLKRRVIATLRIGLWVDPTRIERKRNK